jgi:hypothetical protein
MIWKKWKEGLVMKNRYGDEYHWEKLNDKEYKFVMEGDSMKYCRYGGKEGQEKLDINDLGMFDPSGGPYVGVGSGIYWDEIKGAEEQQPLTVTRIRSTDEGFVVEVE